MKKILDFKKTKRGYSVIGSVILIVLAILVVNSGVESSGNSDEDTENSPVEKPSTDSVNESEIVNTMGESVQKGSDIVIIDSTKCLVLSDLEFQGIVLDPAHGGKDSGAIVDGIKEKDITLSIAKHVNAFLMPDVAIEPILLRDDDVYMKLDEKIEKLLETDLLVSIHCDASPDSSDSGVHIMYNDDNYKGLSELICTNLCEELSVEGIISKSNLGVLLGNNQAPVIMINAGYMTNKEELDNLLQEEYQMKIAKEISHALTIRERISSNE